MPRYKGIINGCRQKAGENAYPEILIYSINMIEMISFIEQDRWDEVMNLRAHAINKLSVAGADFAAIASNTPRLVLNEICARSPIPLLSIVEETFKHIDILGYQRILAIGTLFTMKSGLYSEPLKKCGGHPASAI